MSCLMATDRHLSHVADFLAVNTKIMRHQADCPIERAALIGAWLHAENLRAYNGRYPDQFGKLALDFKYQGSTRWPVTLGTIRGVPGEVDAAIFTLKQITFLLYQLAEEATIKGEVYEALEKISFSLAGEIIAADPRYTAAPWGMND